MKVKKFKLFSTSLCDAECASDELEKKFAAWQRSNEWHIDILKVDTSSSDNGWIMSVTYEEHCAVEYEDDGFDDDYLDM